MTLGYRFNRWPFKHKKKSSSRSGRAEKSNLNPRIGLHGLFFFFSQNVFGENHEKSHKTAEGCCLPALAFEMRCRCCMDNPSVLAMTSVRLVVWGIQPLVRRLSKVLTSHLQWLRSDFATSIQSRFRCRSVFFSVDAGAVQERGSRDEMASDGVTGRPGGQPQERLRVKRATLLYIQHHMSHTFPKPTPFTGLVPHCSGACLLHVAWNNV